MRSLKNKTRNQGGFTLIEMLIVVAIIAILVAVSIPLVNSALERARQATDAANERAAKAEATIMYLTEKVPGHEGPLTDDAKGLVYDAVNGKLVSSGTGVTGYGKCSDMGHKGGYITVDIKKDGTVTIKWTGSDVTQNPHDSKVSDS